VTTAAGHRFAITLVIGAALGCEHPVAYVDVQERREPVAGTQTSTGDPVRVTLEVLGEPDPNGHLRVRASEHRRVSERVRVARSATQLYNRFQGPEPIVKTIVTPIGIALFGVILWSPALHTDDEPSHDHDGDGHYDASEYFSDLVSWFNPFGALAHDNPNTQRRPVELTPREETQTREVPTPLSGVRIQVQRMPSGPPLDAVTNSEGIADFDLAAALRGALGAGAELRLALAHGDPPPTQDLAMPPDVVASIVERRFPGEMDRAPAAVRIRLVEQQRATAEQAWSAADFDAALRIASNLAAAHSDAPGLLDWCLTRHRERIQALWDQGQHEAAAAVARDLLARFPGDPLVRSAMSRLYEERIRSLWDAEDYGGAVAAADRLGVLLSEAGVSERSRALEELARGPEGARIVALTVRDICTEQVVQEGELGGQLAPLDSDARTRKLALLRGLLEAGADPNRFRIVGQQQSLSIPLGGNASLFTAPQSGEIVEGTTEGVSVLRLAEASNQAELVTLLERFDARR
jgi:hypothetical protein